MRNTVVSTLLAALLTASALPASADIIELRDGRKVSGSLTRQGDAATIKTDDGEVITAKPDDVLRVTLTGTITPAEAATAEWTRISQLIRTADDLATVLALHQSFLDKYSAAPVAAEARASWGVYQKLADSNAVKFRGKWVPRAQIEVILRGWTDAARPATEQYRAGHYKEALDAIKPVIDADKDNPNALTIAGLSAYRLNYLPLARGYFSALVTADPGSPLAENNLGVISFLQKQPGEGLAHYGRALQIAPDNRLVLDNIIEAVNAYLAGGNDKNSPAIKNLQRIFDPAEKHMEETLAKQGLVRRGSTWIGKEQADKLAADQKTMLDQYAALEGQYNSAKAAVAQDEALMAKADSDYNQALVGVLIINDQIVAAQQQGNGTLVVQLLNSRDLTVINANRYQLLYDQYRLQRDQVIAGSRDLFAQAQRLQTAILATTIRFSGTQRIMNLGEAESPPAPSPLP